jgi:hypothetical protein
MGPGLPSEREGSLSRSSRFSRRIRAAPLLVLLGSTGDCMDAR